MAKKLIIVESPAKVKTIKKFLGSEYAVEASYGHVRDLPKTTMGIDIAHDYKPHYKVLTDKKDVVEKLKKSAKDATKIYLATDPDREGEAISWHLAELLKVDKDNFCRIEFNEITKSAVMSAIKNPRELNTNLIDAQQARRVLDRLVGYELSPVLWHKVKSHLSAGRVQSVVVRLICDREEEIAKFVSEEYWSLAANVKDPKGKKKFEVEFYSAGGKKIKLSDADTVQKIKDRCTDKFVVQSIKKSTKIKRPLPPFITSTLQQEAFRSLNFSTSRTMKTAQDIYEGVEVKNQGTVGLITYMRTDSTRVSNEALDAVRNMIRNEYGEKYLPSTPNFYSNKKNSQDAHEAIRPTYLYLTPDAVADSLSPDQFKLYKLIYERFVASQMKPAEYDVMNVDVNNNGTVFRAVGSQVKFDGYKCVYEDEDKAENSKNRMLPELEIGDELQFVSWKEQQHFTQPAPRYTEASLVKKLEELGIGRPSTYAPTIAIVHKRNYIKKEQKSLIPTDIGTIVNKILMENFGDIVSYQFTADMETKLDEIEEGKRDWVKVIDEFYHPFDKAIKEADSKIEKVKLQQRVTDIPCEKCGKMMVIKEGRYGEFLACPDYPKCKFTKAIVEESDYSCPKCGGKLIYKRSKKGSRFLGCKNYPTCNFASMYPPSGNICPKCGDYMQVRNGRNGEVELCKNFKCGFQRPFEKDGKDHKTE